MARRVPVLHWLVIALALALAALLSVGIGSAGAQTPQQEEPPEDFVPGEILVKFEPGTPGTEKQEVHEDKGGERIEAIPKIGVEVVQVPSGEEESRAADYSNDPNVQYAELNGIYQAIETKAQ